MSGKFFGADGSNADSKLDPFTERRVGERLRVVLKEHADSVEPAPNSYLTLSKRVEEEAAAPGPKRSGRAGGRILAAAAMFIVVAGAGGYVISQARTGDVSAVGNDGADDAVAVTTTIATTTTVLTTTEPTPTTGSTTAPEPPAPAVELAVLDRAIVPASAKAEDAAAEFTHLLGLPGVARFASQDDMVAVLPPNDGDQALAEVTTEDTGDGFVATGATSDTMQISEVFLDGDELVVLGQAIAFEALVEVHLIGTDGTRLASTFTTAGCCEELVPFEARLPVTSTGQGFVVAHGDGAGSGVVPTFSAVPVEFSAPNDSTTYTVFRIPPDDSDQGLNLRDLPGTDEGRVLATLPPGETGIKRLSVMPALVGDSFWWQVETAEGLQGWAHSWFLTPNSNQLTETELIESARNAVFNIQIGDFSQIGDLSRRTPVALGWLADPGKARGPELISNVLWAEAGTWSVPEATFGESEKVISLRSLLDPADLLNSEPEIVAEARPIYGFETEWVDNFFAGTRAVTVVGDDSGDRTTQSMVLFFEAGPTGPQIVGIVASIFVP